MDFFFILFCLSIIIILYIFHRQKLQHNNKEFFFLSELFDTFDNFIDNTSTLSQKTSTSTNGSEQVIL